MDVQRLLKNDLLWTAFNTYRTSDQTNRLKSEANRTLLADHFEALQVPALSSICLKVISKNYKGRPISLDLKPIQMRLFYDFIDVELPIDTCINIDEEYYWKRVFTSKCTDKMLVKRLNKEKGVNWKSLGITLKLVEIVENIPYEIFNHEEMIRLSKLVSPYVTELKISKLQGKRESTFRKEQNLSNPSITTEEEKEKGLEVQQKVVEYDYPVQDCHHIDLCFVKKLHRLHSLTLEFHPPKLGLNYHSRYFNLSYVDIQYLGSGILELRSLKVFRIQQSRMDHIKLSTILEALKATSVEHLEFSFCQLDDECGESLYEFVISTENLKKLDLSGNYFKSTAIDYLSEAILKSPSKLTYFDLSKNPISDDSLCSFIQALLTCKHLSYVNLSGISVSPTGAECIANLVKHHSNIEELQIIAVPMDGHTLVNALESNSKIQQLLCMGCGLELEDEFKIDLLLKRNRYIKVNPYIGDATRTEAEINAFVSRIKNPILLKALAAKEKRMDCLQKQAEQSSALQESFEIEQSSSLDESDFGMKDKKISSQLAEKYKQINNQISLYGQSENYFFQKQKKSISHQ